MGFFSHLLNIARVSHTFLCANLSRQTVSSQTPSQQTTKSVDFRMFSHQGPVPGSENTWSQRPDRTISVNTNIPPWLRTTKRHSSKFHVNSVKSMSAFYTGAEARLAVYTSCVRAGGLQSNSVHTATYCTGPCTYASALWLGATSLMW